MNILVVVVLLVLVAGALPTWGHSREWGYGPSGIGGFILLVFVLLLLTGRL